MLSIRACALSIPLSLIMACAGSPAPVAEAPGCECEPEPSITVSDPSPHSPGLRPRFANDLVDLRLFVVAQADGSDDEGLPESIRDSNLCGDDQCSLVLSPRLVGRSSEQMKLELGEGDNNDVFVLEAQPQVLGGQIDLHLSARLLPDGAPPHETQRFKFSGVLEPGQITHVGTFYADAHGGPAVGPQVFAVAEYTAGES